MVTRIGRGTASEEEVKKISKTVSEQSAAVAENSAAISENTAAIAENADAIVENAEAIADETAAREAAVEELNEKIDAIQSFKMEVVDELPATGEAGTIYLVKDAGKDTYTEYVYANGAWEKLGSEVDLSDYAKTADVEDALALKANADAVYTKDEVDAAVAPLAVKDEVDNALDLKADADAVYTKDEADAKFLTEHQDISALATKTELEEAIAPLAVKTDVDDALALKADADAVYTKDEADDKFLTEHQDISNLATKDEVSEKANAADVYTKDEADAKFLTEHQDISNLATKDEVAAKADADAVYTKDEADAKFITEHQDISGLASKTELEEAVAPLAVKSAVDEAINQEADQRAQGDAAAIAAVGAVTTALDAEITARQEALSAETLAREAAIAELHEEIVALPKFKILIVDELPAVGDTATFYLLATGDEQGNVYTEYVYVNGAWEEIGTQSLDLAEYAKVADVDAAIADVNDQINTLSGVVETLTYEFESVDEKLAGLAEANAEQDAEIALKAYAADVYTKTEADAKFLTEHQDISALATKAEVEAVDAKVDAIVIPDLTPYALTADVATDIAAAVAAQAALQATKDAEQDEAMAEINSGLTELDAVKADKAELEAAIAGKEAEIYNLTKIVGDLGGAVTYELPGENGKSFNTLMGNNGTVKLVDDVTTGRFGPGITAKNTVKLNLNSHDLTITGLTTASAQAAIMARGTQVITIYGKGTVDAGEGICIEGNGADSVINLTGSTSVYRNDRSGGELIYCYAGTINITNGTFRNDGEDKSYMLNCYDANYRNGTAKIVVTGGKFYDFNPADNSAEGEHTSFVPEGYESVASTVVEEGVEHTVYTVKKSA